MLIYVVLGTSHALAITAGQSCAQPMLTGPWALLIYLYESIGCPINVSKTGTFASAGACTTPGGVALTSQPSGTLKISSNCQVTGNFRFSYTSFASDVITYSSSNEMWLSSDETRISGFGMGVSRIQSQTSSLGAVQLEFISRAPKTP
jgi:hypothetical protein